MGEIKFGIESMKQVSNEIETLKTQLSNIIENDSEQLNIISNNIESDEIKGTLTSYVETNKEKSEESIKLLNEMYEYLQTKINSYQRVDEKATNELSEVENLLKQLEGEG